MRKRSLITYVLAVDLAALALLPLVAREGLGGSMGTVAVLSGLAALAGLWPVRLPSLRLNVAAFHPFVLCALAAAGPLAMVLASLAAVLGVAIGRRSAPGPFISRSTWAWRF